MFRNRIEDIDRIKSEIDKYSLFSVALAKEEPLPCLCLKNILELG
jgi:hypothetical protein